MTSRPRSSFDHRRQCIIVMLFLQCTECSASTDGAVQARRGRIAYRRTTVDRRFIVPRCRPAARCVRTVRRSGIFSVNASRHALKRHWLVRVRAAGARGPSQESCLVKRESPVCRVRCYTMLYTTYYYTWVRHGRYTEHAAEHHSHSEFAHRSAAASASALGLTISVAATPKSCRAQCHAACRKRRRASCSPDFMSRQST